MPRGEREADDFEVRFMEALGDEARKYAVRRRALAGPAVYSLTLAQLPQIALAALRRVTPPGGPDAQE